MLVLHGFELERRYHAASYQLAEACTGRFVLGLSVGYDVVAPLAGLEYGTPLTQYA